MPVTLLSEADGDTLRGVVRHFDILVAPGFVASELAAIVDALNIANRVIARPLFEWSFVSRRGGQITSKTGVSVEANRVPDRPDAAYLFVIGNTDPDNPDLSYGAAISTYTFRGAQVFLLAEAASRYISETGGESSRHTTHWENTALMRERLGSFDTGACLAVEEGQVVTCAGMSATLDIILSVIGRHVSAAATRTVADIFLHEMIRDFGTRQPFSGFSSTTTGDSELDQCLDLMQANIEEPLPIAEICDLIHISNRSLERKFRSFLNTTPASYYRELRLSRANNLLLNTTMSVQDIGLACGFPSGFSGLYKTAFGVTPLSVRKNKNPATS